MSLTERIDQLRDHDIPSADRAVKEARKELWEANYVRKNDERRPGESDDHWKARKLRNRKRYEKRDDVVDQLTKKREALEVELKELVEKKREYKEQQAARKAKFDRNSSDIVVFDGKPCVESAAYWAQLARDKGLWHGYMTSGYRTPEYSQQLCYQICGAPSCPGRCAGTSSNHTKRTSPGPAIDVSNYDEFEHAMATLGAPLRNDLPIDPVHFSPTGH